MCFEGKEIGTRGVGEEEQGLGSQEEAEDSSRINLGQDVGNRIQVAGGIHSLPQGPSVHWDRFLPIRSLKVLLVENDDSTRHVVSALLRNCSYEVSGAANGLQAWKILEDPNNHTDIILTEVVMPVISGVALLCKIMSHKSLKNIPVIMMSSHDSMGLVFKCLSKGAVDFLVKPIRKNELKNLWQHVWRRCHSSSGSGSESGTESRKYIKSKSNGESDNNSRSSEEQDNGSTCLSIRDGSDHGSGTQSSRAAGVHSPPSLSLGGLLTDSPDSTCAQVIHTKHEKHSNAWTHSTEAKDFSEEDGKFDDHAIDKDTEVRVTRKADLQCEHQLKKLTFSVGSKQNKLPEVDGNQGMLDQMGEKNCGANANCNKPQPEGRVFGTSIEISDASHVNGNGESGDFPSLEFSLKRLRGAGDVRTAALDDCNGLRHSGQSAFSKYNTPSSNQAPTGNTGSCSPFGSSSAPPSTGPPPNQQSNESTNKNNDDMASTNEYEPPKPESFTDNPDPTTSTFKSSHTSAFQPVQSSCVCVAPTKAGEEPDPEQAPGRQHNYQQVQVQHHHHHYHLHVHKMQQQQQEEEDDHGDFSLKSMAATAQQCGSSNVFDGTNDAQFGNYSVNGSASGSNHGSNGQNGKAMNGGMMHVESDHGVAGNSGGGGISQRSEVDETRVAQREAALTKFRLKRKDRCFEKRVRYHNRKKLAEQRPRIRGQFVRSDTKAGEDCQSEEFKSEDNSGNSLL